MCHADARGLASASLPNSPAIQGPRRRRARLQVHPQLTRDPKALRFPSMNHVPTEALSLVLDQWLKSAARALRSGWKPHLKLTDNTGSSTVPSEGPLATNNLSLCGPVHAAAAGRKRLQRTGNVASHTIPPCSDCPTTGNRRQGTHWLTPQEQVQTQTLSAPLSPVA